MIDYKGRVESYSREMLRKESQIKEMQTRLETGDGCKYQNIVTYTHTTRLLGEISIKLPFFLSFSYEMNNIFIDNN